MSWNSATALSYYVSAIVAVWAILAFYYHVSRFDWREDERRRFEQAQLNLGNLLSLIEAPDFGLLAHSHPARRYLFLEYSRFLKEDVLSLVRLRRLSPSACLWAALFFLSYFCIRLKAKLYCAPNDLRFLTGLELGLVRNLQA